MTKRIKRPIVAKVNRPSRKALLQWADKQKFDDVFEWVVFRVLVDFSDAEGMSFPSIDTICTKAPISRASAKRALRSLVNMGILNSVERRAANGRQRSNCWVFNLEVNSVQTDAQQRVCQTPSPGPIDPPITLNSSTSEVKCSIRGKVASSDSGRGGYRWGPADGVWGDEIPHQTWEELIYCVGGVQ